MGILDWLFGRRASKHSTLGHNSQSVRALRDGMATARSSPPTPTNVANSGSSGRFGTDRHKPAGHWVQTTMTISVAGVQHRKRNVDGYSLAVRQAASNRKKYGVRLRPEPGNQHDPNAIAVDGFVDNDTWHIGYLDQSLAKEMRRDLLNKGIPIDAELYSIWVGDNGFTEFKIIILAPPGHGTKARIKARTKD